MQGVEFESKNYKVSIGYYDLENRGIKIYAENLIDGSHNELLYKCNNNFLITTPTEDDTSQSVMLQEDKLIVSFFRNLVCFNIPDLTVKWNLELDKMPLYEFIQIENDLLIRGELQIFRISLEGEILWRTYGEDIWVNIDGKKEMQLIDDEIVLSDFNDKTYYFKIAETRGVTK